VAETHEDTFELLGDRSLAEERAWTVLEQRGLLTVEQVDDVLGDAEERAGLDSLVERRLVFRSPKTGRIHALSQLARHLL